MVENTKLYQELQKRKSKYTEKVIEIYNYASEVLPKINRIFANYTGHGVEHSINVMQYMYDLVTDISSMSDLEITCFIYAALLHDIGMVANEIEIEEIRKDQLNYHGRKFAVIFEKYQDENIALQECIRPVHGERSLHHIMQMKKDFFIIPEFTNCNFQEELAKICQAHTMNREWLLHNLASVQVKGNDKLNAQFVAMLLRIADYLDIDEKRAPIELYKILAPTGFGDEEWRQHYIIDNKEKVVKDNISGSGTIVIYGTCNDSKIYRKFLKYLSGVSEELMWCTSYTRKYFEKKYWILLQPQIDNRIQTKEFEISDLKLQIDYNMVIKLLMGENLYGDKRYGLRELLQNAVDACQVMAEEAKLLEKYCYVPYIPKIQIILDYKIKKAIVMDNGIGMGNDVLEKYFLNIGRSYYKSEEFLFQGKNYCPIGAFGIGFLACFMLSGSVTVETKHYIEQEGFIVELERDSEYVCKKNCVKLIGDSGTAIILDLESVLGVFGQKVENIKEYLENTFLNQGVQVDLITINDGKNEEKVDLKEFEELNPGGGKLDSYLNGIVARWNVRFDRSRVRKKFSDLFIEHDETEQGVGQLFATYDFDTGTLCLKDIEGEELIKYIENDRIRFLKIQGVMKQEKESYEEWKNDRSSKPLFSHNRFFRNVYIPVKYDAFSHEQFDGYITGDGISGVNWYHSYKNKSIGFFSDLEKGKIIDTCEMVTETVAIKLGEFFVIKVGCDRYIKYKEDWSTPEPDPRSEETYWHGIKLKWGNIFPYINIFGVYGGKCVINILNKDILPNITRDNLATAEKQKIKLALERAACQYIVSTLDDDKELQAALQHYIDLNYSADNPYYSNN